MLIFLQNYKISSRSALSIAGYKRRRWGDFILEDVNGRFHAHIIDSKVISVHYDLFVEDRHFAPHMPDTVGREVKRIVKRLQGFKLRDMESREYYKLRNKYHE